jgi:hypothetical protein
MKLQTPIRITSLRVDTTSAEYQQIAKTAMQRVALVTDPTLTKEQKQVLYELHMPGMSGQHSGIQRQVTESGQIIDIVQDGNATRQTYESSRNNGIPGTAAKRETVNGYIVDFV